MLDTIALFVCLPAALTVLVILSVIDLRERLLPNELVAGFAVIGLVFHLATLARFVAMPEIVAGGVIGFGVLYLIRAAANAIYKRDTLGLGDVKLMGAGGLWLGSEGIMLALSVGAFISVLHGVFYALHKAKMTGAGMDFRTLSVPAGPGLAAGLVLTVLWQFGLFDLPAAFPAIVQAMPAPTP